MKVKADTTNVAAHFLFNDQFLGFRGSSGPDQVTYTVLVRVSLIACSIRAKGYYIYKHTPDLGHSRISQVFLPLPLSLSQLYHYRLAFAAPDLENHSHSHRD